MELLAPVLFYLCCLPGLICDLCTGTGSQHNQPAENAAAGSSNQPQVLAMSAVPVVLHLCMELTKDSGIRDAQ
jgi:hypothetical protein